MNDIEPVRALDQITDGDILSYFQARDTSCFITYDLGKTTTIGKVVFSPRNDDNYVWPGDEYELFYQDGVKRVEIARGSNGYRLGTGIPCSGQCVVMAA